MLKTIRSKQLTKKDVNQFYKDFNYDYTKTLTWKIVFAISLTGFIIFLTLFLNEHLQNNNKCLPGSQNILSCSKQTKYVLTYSFTWDGPENSHFDTPIGVSYYKGVNHFWTIEEKASAGVKDLVVNNNVNILKNEMKNSNLTFFVSTKTSGGIVDTSVYFIAEPNHRYLTLITAMVPLNNIFTGISGLDLCDSDGNWKNYVSSYLLPIELNSNTSVMDYVSDSKFENMFHSKPIGSISLVRIPLS